MKFIVHAGQPKAGSTAIQAFLGANRSQLAVNRVMVPRYRLGGSHQWMIALATPVSFLERKAMAFRHGRLRPTPGWWLATIARLEFLLLWVQLRLLRPDTVILSAEQFLGLRSPATAGRFAGVLRFLGADEIEIVLFLRDPVQHSVSQLLEQLKRGTADKHALPPSRPLAVMDFVKHFSRFSDVQLSFFEYRGRQAGQDVRLDFIRNCLHHPSLEGLVLHAEENNPSISPEVGYLLSIFRETHYPQIDGRPRPSRIRQLKEQLIAAEEELGGPLTPRISAEARDAIESLSQPYLEWLETKHGFSFSSSGQTSSIPITSTDWLLGKTGSRLVSAVFELDDRRISALVNATDDLAFLR